LITICIGMVNGLQIIAAARGLVIRARTMRYTGLLPGLYQYTIIVLYVIVGLYMALYSV
jgi:hypothetical protein